MSGLTWSKFVASSGLVPWMRSQAKPLAHHGAGLIQSIFAPERLITSAHLAESCLINAANSSGVPPAGSSPIRANLS